MQYKELIMLKNNNLYEDELLTDEQAATMAKVSPNTIRYWRQIRLLPSIKVGKHPRIWLSVFNKVFQKPDDNITQLGTLGGTHE